MDVVVEARNKRKSNGTHSALHHHHTAIVFPYFNYDYNNFINRML